MNNYFNNDLNQTGLCPAFHVTLGYLEGEIAPCPVLGSHKWERHRKGRFCVCSIRHYTYVDSGYEVYVWDTPCGEFRLIASCLLTEDWFTYLRYGEKVTQVAARPKELCCTCLSWIQKHIQARGFPVVLSSWQRDLTREGIEPNPGPDLLWEIKDYCQRNHIEYRCTFEGYGPDHDRRFICVIFLAGKKRSEAHGLNKKHAEQAAAAILYNEIFSIDRLDQIRYQLGQLKEIQLRLKALGVEKRRWMEDLTIDGDVESNPGPFLEKWWNRQCLLCTECTCAVSYKGYITKEYCHPGFACAFIVYPSIEEICPEDQMEFERDPSRYIAVTRGAIGRYARIDEDLWAMEHPVYENYYQWLPNELRFSSFSGSAFVDSCERFEIPREEDSPMTYILWDRGAYHALEHGFLIGEESELTIARYRLRMGDIYEYAGEKPWKAWYNFFRAFKVDYDLENHTIVPIVEERVSLHFMCNEQITEGHFLAKQRFGMNLKNVLLAIRQVWLRDLTEDGDIESNPGPWSELWHTFRYVVEKMKHAGYPDYDSRTRIFLSIFRVDSVDDFCGCENKCHHGHSWQYYFQKVNAFMDECCAPSEHGSESHSFHSKKEESVYSVPSDEKKKPPSAHSEGRKFNGKASRTLNIVRTALSNRSVKLDDAEVEILVQHFDLGVFWCNISHKLRGPFCHPAHQRRISMLHDTISALLRGDFSLGRPKPEEVLEGEKMKEGTKESSGKTPSPPPTKPGHRRSHPRSKRSSHQQSSWLPPDPPGINNNEPLPQKWAFLEKYWANLKLSDDIGAGVGLSYEILPWWRLREPCEDEDFELLVIGWAEYAFFSASEIPTLKPNSIDKEELNYRHGLDARQEEVCYVLGPAPYANKLGFFFNEMWLPEHYDALKEAGYYPCWIHQEFCFYRKEERSWNYLEPRYGIRQVTKTPLIKWLWTLEEMEALFVIVDLDCPNLFLNLVQVSDGSYAVAGRKCRSLKNSYVNYWSVVVDGTVLYQGMKSAKSNEQQMMASHCTNEAVQFLRGWITNSRIIRGLQSVLEHEDVRGKFSHNLDPFGRDTSRNFPDAPDPPNKETRAENYVKEKEWLKEIWEGFWTSEAPSPFSFGDDYFEERCEGPELVPGQQGFYSANYRRQWASSLWQDPENYTAPPPHFNGVDLPPFPADVEYERPDSPQLNPGDFDFESLLSLIDIPIPDFPLRDNVIGDRIEHWYGGVTIGGNYEFPDTIDALLFRAGNAMIRFNSLVDALPDYWANIQERVHGLFDEFASFCSFIKDSFILGGLVVEHRVIENCVEFYDVVALYFNRLKEFGVASVPEFLGLVRGMVLDVLCACGIQAERAADQVVCYFSRLRDLPDKLESFSDACISELRGVVHREFKNDPSSCGWLLAGCALLARFQSYHEVAVRANLFSERLHIRDLRSEQQEWELSCVRQFLRPGRDRYVNGIGSKFEDGKFEIDSPVILQMDTTVTIDDFTWSIYDPAPYDKDRLKVSIFYEPQRYPAVRPECIFWVYLFDMYVPSPHSSLWTTVYRCGKTPPVFEQQKVDHFEQFARTVYEGMAQEMVVQWRSPSWEGLTGPILKETMENMAARQAALRYEDYEACILGEKKADSHHDRAFTKVDENPGGGKPRHIFNATHWAFQNLQPGLFDIKKALKKEKEVQYDGFTFMMPQPHIFEINGWRVHVTYMADTDQLQDAYWMYCAMNAEPGEIHIAVGGDDNTAVANIDGVLYQIEGDLSMCDQSMHKVFCCLFIYFCHLVGASHEFLEVLRESYRNPCIFFYKHDIHTSPEVMAIIMFIAWMLRTGSPQTSAHNTVLLFTIVSWALIVWSNKVKAGHYSSPEEAKDFLVRVYASLGLKMKLHVYVSDHILVTFHKKYFIRQANGCITASFLPGASLPRILRVRTSTVISEKTFWDRISDGASSRMPVVAHPVIHKWLLSLAQGKIWRPGELVYKGVSSVDVGSKYANEGEFFHEELWMIRYGLDLDQIRLLLNFLEHELWFGHFYDARARPELQSIFEQMWRVDNA